MPPVIVAQDLYKRYPGFPPVLKGVNIEVEAGEAVAIMGPSGCGKSTMLHIVGLLHAPDAGKLEILGQNVLAFDREQTAAFRRGNLGFVMQANNLFEHSTVFENVEFPLIYDNVPPQERWARVIRALELVRLSARVHYRGNRLSGGEQQRVAIARAMVNNPRVLLADEPTGALDSRTSALIMENFRRLCHEGGVAMMMVTHDPKMAEYCDSIYVLEDGVLREKKHVLPPAPSGGHDSPLNPVEPIARGALVANRFPDESDPNLTRLASRLNDLSLLSRIYSLSPGAILGSDDAYSLALPARHMNPGQRIKAYWNLFRGARGSVSLWSLWKTLPARAHFGREFVNQFKAFAFGARLSRWAFADKAQFFYAVGARRAATVAWVAGALAKLPFAFSIRGEDLSHFNQDWAPKSAAASFIVCPTRAILNKAREKLPLVPADKFILVRDALPTLPEDGETETDAPPGPRPLELLAINQAASPNGFRHLLDACVLLKKQNVSFNLSLLGSSSWEQRRALRERGLGKNATFLGGVNADAATAAFKNADVYLVYPPEQNGSELDLPWHVSEAMAFAAVIITSVITPGMAEALRPNENCLTFDGSPASLAKEIEALAANPQRRRELGGRAREDILKLIDAEGGSRKLGDYAAQAAGLAERAESDK